MEWITSQMGCLDRDPVPGPSADLQRFVTIEAAAAPASAPNNRVKGDCLQPVQRD